MTVACAAGANNQRPSSSALPTAIISNNIRAPPPSHQPSTPSVRSTVMAAGSTSATSTTVANTPASAIGYEQQSTGDTQTAPQASTLLQTKRKKWRPPQPVFNHPIPVPANTSLHGPHIVQEELTGSIGGLPLTNTVPGITAVPSAATSQPTSTASAAVQAPKRRKVGLSRVSNITGSAVKSSFRSPRRPPSTQLEFPTAARCTNFTGKNSSHLMRRSLTLGSRFASTNLYKDGMTFLIYEHLQIMVIEIAIAMWNIKTGPNTREPEALDATYRSRGIPMHSGSTLRRRGDVYVGFPMFTERGFNSAGNGPGVTTAAIQPPGLQGLTLTINNKEHHSKYSKDDLWVISTTSRFDAASTFFARSMFYGPSGSDVELQCLSSKDSSVARDIVTNSNEVCAIRLFNAMSEFMMLDNLSERLARTPILPVLLNYVPPELVKASKTSVFKVPTRVPEKTGCIVLTEEDGVDVEQEIQDTIDQYRLNQEQAQVLRDFARMVIRAPGWVQKTPDSPPVLLVHGVFGAGKSFLIAVLIVFIDGIIDKARPSHRDERSCRFLVASMTNVAVDRILTALLDLKYNNFVRVGSLKKIARRLLPYTSQSTSNRSAEEVKELQSILNDDSISDKERQYVKDAMKKFQKHENRDIIGGANVVGATCIASVFEVLDEASFPIVILDEASQLLEAMSLIPICRAAAEKLILVGDPLQLSPPISTFGDNSVAGKGLSRTLFDRFTEMGMKPVMLRTQYRCHHRIAAISNALFYSNVLQTGINAEERAPLIDGLPTLSFIHNAGQEVQNTRTKSFTNPMEVKLVVTIVQRLLSLNVPGANIGVISLYKSQADCILSELKEQLKNSGQNESVQISTVDAFQGSEKDVIIVSTVRTDSIGFIDNHQRVNVALTRGKRHLFITGNSQLLSTSNVWGPVMKDHCDDVPDGFMSSDQFVQRLRTLKPLPRQVEVRQSPPLESEDTDVENQENNEDENVLDDGQDETGHSYTDSRASVLPKTYMLYEADEDDSDQSHDEWSSRPSHRIQQPSRSGGNAPRMYGHIQSDGKDMQRHQDVTDRSSVSMGPVAARQHTTLFEKAENGHKSLYPSPSVQRAGSTSNFALGFGRQSGTEPQSGPWTLPTSPEGVPEWTESPKTEDPLRSIREELEQEFDEPEGTVSWEMDDQEEDDHEGYGLAQDPDGVDEASPRHSTAVQPHSNGSQDAGFMASYESQRLEDLDFTEWSQLTGKQSTSAPRSLGHKPDSQIVSKRTAQDYDDEDDIGCLELGDLDM